MSERNEEDLSHLMEREEENDGVKEDHLLGESEGDHDHDQSWRAVSLSPLPFHGYGPEPKYVVMDADDWDQGGEDVTLEEVATIEVSKTFVQEDHLLVQSEDDHDHGQPWRAVSLSPLPFHGYGPEPNYEAMNADRWDQGGEDVSLEEVIIIEEARNKGGRPKGKGRSEADKLAEGQTVPTGRRHPAVPPSNWKPRDNKTAGVSPRQREPGSTESRPTYYLVGKAATSLTCSKLPKTIAVLGRFLEFRKNDTKQQAAILVTQELVSVWLHHFGPKLILGKEYGRENLEKKDMAMIMIHNKQYIEQKIVNLHEQWRRLEQDSRRMDRSSRPAFQQKEKQFSELLEMPYDITKIDAINIIQQSGIMEWKEEVTYLQGQLQKDQVGCPGSWDSRQKKRDERRLKTELRREAMTEKERLMQEDLKIKRNSQDSDNEESGDENENKDNEEYSASPVQGPRRKKIDIMGKISLTCDARNISTRDRTMVAASVVNALGIDINETNINKTTAWEKGRKVRLEKAQEIKDNFNCPDMVVAHWDGKTLALRGRIESKRVCVYLSGVDAEKTRKLLGIPECISGKGVDEFEITKEFLVEWKVKEQLVGMVFDTTASNSGEYTGACRYLEIWVGHPILWLACRRHVAELHIGTAVKYVMGCTKDPGMALFRRLRDQWNEMEINYEDLVLFNLHSVSPDLQEKSKSVLAWAEVELENKTFPRDDYRELMELMVVSLGGNVKGFNFKLPGPDHHARWMSKCLYILKIKLLSNQFQLSEEEMGQVTNLAEFILLFYAKFWFVTPLADAAARTDIEFMSDILQYRLVNSGLAYQVLRSCYRHMWYLTPQLVTLALTDRCLEDDMKEKMAKTIHSLERKVLKTGKPTFPELPFGATVTRKDMSYLVGPESWVIFDLLGLSGPQDWLLAPASTWHTVSGFLMLEKFAEHLVVVNDLAERGIHLASDFIKRVESEEQRNALFQVVEDFRARVKDCTKKNLKLV
jgi:hypothetical protein